MTENKDAQAGGEAVAWRATLAEEQRPQRPDGPHIMLFNGYSAADAWVFEQLDFYGWRYTIEPLYTKHQPAAVALTQLRLQYLWTEAGNDKSGMPQQFVYARMIEKLHGITAPEVKK